MTNGRAGNSHKRNVIAVLFAATVILLTLIYLGDLKVSDISPEENSSLKQHTADSTSGFHSIVNNEDSIGAEDVASKYNQFVSVNDAKLFSARDMAAKANQLPIENYFMTGPSLDARNTLEFVDSLDFSKEMLLFEGQMFKDPLAIELRNEYQNQIREETKQVGIDVQLTKLVCGLRICAGVFRTPNPTSFDVWSTHLMGPTSSRIPMFSITQSQVYVYGTESEQRFLFTISEENNSFVHVR